MRVRERVEAHQRCPRGTQRVEVVRVVEPERAILRDADPDVGVRGGGAGHRDERRLGEERRDGDARQQEVEVDLSADRGTQVGDAPRHVVRLVRRHEAQVALDDREPRIVVDGADDRDVGVVLDHHPELRLVAAAPEVVEDDADDRQVAVERLVAEDERRDAARHAARVEDEHDRESEGLRERRVAVAAVEREAVVEPLVALDQRDVGARGVALEGLDDLVVGREPRVEVAAAPPARRREPHRVDEVGALLERLDAPAARGQRRGEPDAHRGLARRLVRRRDQEAERPDGGCTTLPQACR